MNLFALRHCIVAVIMIMPIYSIDLDVLHLFGTINHDRAILGFLNNSMYK